MAMMASSPAERTKVIQHATEALDGWDNAMQWLEYPNPHLSKRRPLDVLFNGTPEEVQRVDELLSSIQQGIYP